MVHSALPLPISEGPLRICSGVAHHLFYLSPFLSRSLYLAFLSPATGTLNLRVNFLVLIFAFPFEIMFPLWVSFSSSAKGSSGVS